MAGSGRSSATPVASDENSFMSQTFSSSSYCRALHVALVHRRSEPAAGSADTIEGDCAFGALTGEYFVVGETRRIIDRDI
jgi:hypothetical protein